ncbi:MAG TPA: cytochrome P450 [Archangium sp.]|uniref:cytochrome P450 n=1 Tax=Archangium sp. TaxID=1872627 RepID=UPI002E32B286|nr:cytochrome P450 [Archangium sp.]HEX5750151.1 cytochrome P450 [Archangium sp.]
MPSLFDPYGLSRPETQQNPYPCYERLRREAPVYFSEVWKGWLLTRHADVLTGFRDARLSSNRSGMFARYLPPEQQERLLPLTRNVAAWALHMDAPGHTRVRSLINKAFSPRLVEALRPRIQELVNRLLDEVEGTGCMEVVRHLAAPLPVIVIGEMMGLPREDFGQLKSWSDNMSRFFGAVARAPELLEEALRAIQEMEDYFRRLLVQRREQPGEDLLSALARAEEQGRLLSEQELLSTCMMVLFGGHETTTALLSNGLYALLRHPEQWALLRQEPERVPMAVEELSRYESPVHRMSRIALEDLEVGGQRVRKGDLVFLVIGAANRDEEVFESPERLDVRRNPRQHLAFGHGAHFCVGTVLARLEAQVALSTVLRRFPHLALEEEAPRWAQNIVIRGLESLPVRWGPPR